MGPLVGAMSILDAGFGYLHTNAPFREQWSITFVSTMLGMLLTAPLILAWSRRGLEEALELTRARLPELLVLYAGLIVTTYYVFGTQRAAPGFAAAATGFVPPLIYLCAPFFIWAALRFGLRAATLGLSIFGLICYWQTAHGFGPFSIGGVADVRSMLHLQGYLATIVVTTLFSRRCSWSARRRSARPRRGATATGRDPRSGNLLYELNLDDGKVIWDGDTQSVLGVGQRDISDLRKWMERVHPDDRIRLKGVRQRLRQRGSPRRAQATASAATTACTRRWA
jgi:hypothetical protein